MRQTPSKRLEQLLAALYSLEWVDGGMMDITTAQIRTWSNEIDGPNLLRLWLEQVADALEATS